MTRAPGLSQWLPLPYGEFGAFLRDPLGFQLRARERFGDIIRFRIGPLLLHFVYHPDHVRQILHDKQKNYLRGWQYRFLQRLLGDNLVVSEGDSWLRQRRLAQPAFHRQRLLAYADGMIDATTQMLDRWQPLAAAGQAIAIGPEMSRLALAIASRTLFDRDVSHEADAVGSAFAVANRYLEWRLNRPFTSPPHWLPTLANRRFHEAVRVLNRIVMDLVRQRRQEGRDHGDLLSILLQARDEETGEGMTDDQLRSQVLTFLLAGHETTATALTWTWYLLATHAAVRQRVRAEVEAVVGERRLTLADVPLLSLTRRVIDESLRLYPPVWAVPRQVVSQDDLGGFVIPASSTILLCPYVTHRHPAAWEEPEVFDPDRFTPARAAGRPKTSWFPFLSGPHQCIGNEFALLEMQLVIAQVLQKFDLETLPNQEVRPLASLTIRPNRSVDLVLKRVDRAMIGPT
jgi:cytochrome P450